MSLNRIAARIAAVQALKGKTLVDDNVLDSVIGALDISADGKISSNEAKPFIAVYCDESTNKDGPTSDMLRALVPNGTTTFLFEAGVTAAMTVIDPETDESVLDGIGIPATDANFEFQLDMIMRQIGDVLSDPANEWAEVFRAFCMRYMSIERNRASSHEGTRLAAHQLKLAVDLFPDPARGTVLSATHPLAMFFALADKCGDTVLYDQVAFMRAQLTGDEHAWQLGLRRYGMTRSQADALQLTPADGAEADITVVEVDAGPVVVAGGVGGTP